MGNHPCTEEDGRHLSQRGAGAGRVAWSLGAADGGGYPVQMKPMAEPYLSWDIEAIGIRC